MSDLYDQSDDEMSDAPENESNYGSDDDAMSVDYEMPLPANYDSPHPLDPERTERIYSAGLPEVITRVQTFAAEVVSLPNDRAKEIATRDFAQSMPTNFNEDDWGAIHDEFERALAPGMNLWPFMHFLEVWDFSVPGSHDEFAIGNPCQLRIRDFALNNIASLTSPEQITEAIASFVTEMAELLPVPVELEYKLTSEFDWNIRDRADDELVGAIFEAFLSQQEGVIDPNELPNSVRERILDFRPNIVWATPHILGHAFTGNSGLPWFTPEYTYPLSVDDSEPRYLASSMNGSAEANALVDMLGLLCCLHSRCYQVIGILEEENIHGLHMPNDLGSFGDKVSAVIAAVKDHAISPGTVQLPDTQELANKFRKALEQFATLLGAYEDQLVAMEACWLAEQSDTQFKASASRFERAKWRHRFKSMIAGLQTESLRQSESLYKPNVLRRLPNSIVSLETRPHADDDSECPICSEEWEEGKSTIPPIVSTCCKRAFHVDCLMSWFYTTGAPAEDEKTCPYCRARVTQELRSELLEWKVKQWNNL